jgi:hypothetical protein
LPTPGVPHNSLANYTRSNYTVRRGSRTVRQSAATDSKQHRRRAAFTLHQSISLPSQPTTHPAATHGAGCRVGRATDAQAQCRVMHYAFIYKTPTCRHRAVGLIASCTRSHTDENIPTAARPNWLLLLWLLTRVAGAKSRTNESSLRHCRSDYTRYSASCTRTRTLRLSVRPSLSSH